MGEMFRPSRSPSGPNLRVQVLHKLTHKMQDGPDDDLEGRNMSPM